MARKGLPITGARVLVLGLAFKENCPDLRNTRVVDILARLREYGLEVDVCDPWVDATEAKAEYGLDLVDLDSTLPGAYAGAVLAVQHREFADAGQRLRELVGNGVIYDVKGALGDQADVRL
jgi:UDP-N-acetyl-D-galactosamine dehydrogenase